MMLRAKALLVAFFCGAGCAAAGGRAWLNDAPDQDGLRAESGWTSAAPEGSPRAPVDAAHPEQAPAQTERPLPEEDDADTPTKLKLVGAARAPAALPAPLFRNTYYDFPREGPGAKTATVYDAACSPIARVTKEFHDAVCVQGSGRLESGATVSFAARGCACAAECPRTGQRICFERLDPTRFPHGRGAAGRAITPLYTIAVDTSIIPLGTPVYIPEFVGLPRPNGAPHTGCFLAEDRGLKVVGRQIDVFTGDPALTARWNKLFPSNQGVHVALNDPHCKPGG